MAEKNPFYGATFAERKAIREDREAESVETDDTKQVDVAEAEDKAISSASTKRTARKRS